MEDVLQAERGGADRVELNACLFHSGLTPSIGALRTAKQLSKLPVMAMVRPRQGGFLYTDPSTANNRDIFYGGALYPPEDRYDVIDGDYIARIAEITGNYHK